MTKNQTSQELILNLYNCSLKVVSSKEKIQEFVDLLCPLIEMKKYGPLRIERFGQKSLFGEGYSFLQFIETSSVTGHLIEINEPKAYINIFSYQHFNAIKAAKFTKEFFKAKRIRKKIIYR